LTVPGAGPRPPALASADLPACTACGACCFSTLAEYVRVFGCDFDRMDDRARAFTHFIGNRAYLRLDEGHCAALVVGADGPSFVCSIYEMRPDVCRSLERGSGACRSDRHEKAERPLLAVANLVRRAAGSA
jgi:uncharacterized protein